MSEQQDNKSVEAATEKNTDNTKVSDSLDIALASLKAVIMTLDPKPQQILSAWITRWGNFLKREKGFDPEFMPFFKRGDIVYVDLGFNVGSEHGGVHYAVIYENNNSRRSKTVVVIPLSSVADKANTASVDIYLGENVVPWTPGVKTIAKPSQIRAISKMRILKPLTASDSKVKMSAAHMDTIDYRLSELLLKPPAKSPTNSKK